jgi:hypothetical protein
MSRVAVAFNVLNSTFGSYLFSNIGGIVDPLAAAVTGAADAATAHTAAVAAQTAMTALTTLIGTAYSDLATANTAAIAFGTAFDAMINTATNGLLALLNTNGGTCTYSSTTKQISGTPAASGITWTAAEQIAQIALFNTCGADMATAVADLATANADTYALGPTPAAVTALATAKTDFGLIATTATNGLIAIMASTSLTYTASTGQLSGTNPSSSETPTQAVCEALITIINTAGAAVVTALADVAAIQVNTSAASTDMGTVTTDLTTVVTDTATVVTDLAAAAGPAQDVVVSINAVKCPTISCLEIGLIERGIRLLQGSNFLTP